MRSKQKIYINPVGTVRPCNKLPTVQCRNGYKMNFRMRSKQKNFISSVGATCGRPFVWGSCKSPLSLSS